MRLAKNTGFWMILLALALMLAVACDPLSSNQTPDCGPDTCLGCCDGEGGCRPGNERAFCGEDGAACRVCVGGRCELNACVWDVPCGPDNCDGCCDGDNVCRPGDGDGACGAGGEVCRICAGGHCADQACVFDFPCGPDNCPGCCDPDNVCQPGVTTAACGLGGAACEACGGDATCSGGSCENTPPPCGPGNCAGCCDAGGVCRGGDQTTACGAGGNACLACGNQLCEDGGCVDPQPTLRIGAWLSPWRLADRTPAQWVAAIKGLSYASSQPARAVVVLAICGAATETTTRCFFPKPSGVPTYSNVTYSTDRVTPIMNAIEADGNIDVILDVEPMHARVSDVMHVAMTAFGNYNCVKGFSPDWEWVTGEADKIQKLPTWNAELQNYKAGMELHLISWMTNAFGTWRDPALSYGFDGQSFTGLSQQLWYFDDWTDHFSPYRAGWYWAYANDSSWTRPLVQNPQELKDLHDQYAAIDPEGTILMATETLYFEIDAWLPTAPMW
jgi:hypothetical protein